MDKTVRSIVPRLQVEGAADGQRLEDWPALAEAVHQCFNALLAFGVHPGRLMRVMQTDFVHNFLERLAAPDAFAPFADPLVGEVLSSSAFFQCFSPLTPGSFSLPSSSISAARGFCQRVMG